MIAQHFRNATNETTRLTYLSSMMIQHHQMS